MGGTKELPDHYLTIPYGLFLLGGGVAGYVSKGSVASLALGGGMGVVDVVFGLLYMSEYYQSPSIGLWLTLVPFASAVLNAAVMGKRYSASGAFMPAGLVAAVSGGAAVYYLLRMVGVLKKRHKKKKRYD